MQIHAAPRPENVAKPHILKALFSRQKGEKIRERLPRGLRQVKGF